VQVQVRGGGERAHDQDTESELGGQWQQAVLDLAFARVVRDLNRIEATGALAESRARALAIVAEAKAALRNADPALELVADGVVERYA